MKLIRAVVPAAEVEPLRKALDALDVGRLAVTEVRGGAAAAAGSAPGVPQVPGEPRHALVELVVDDDHVADVVQELVRSARHTEPAKGRVLVLPLE